MQVLVQDKEKVTALKLKLQSVETELHLLREKRKAETCTWTEDLRVVMKKMKKT